MQLLQNFNMALAFFVELAMLGAFLWSGFSLHQNIYVKLAVGILLPALIVVLWGKYLAPNSNTRLRTPGLEATKIALFALAGAVLWVSEHRTASVIFLAVSLTNLLLAVLWHQA